jgi:hypothetical protein
MNTKNLYFCKTNASQDPQGGEDGSVVINQRDGKLCKKDNLISIIKLNGSNKKIYR